MNKSIVGLGEILWDILPSGKQMGGAPANFAYFAQQLGGVKSIVVSCIGYLQYGNRCRTRWMQAKMTLNNIYNIR